MKSIKFSILTLITLVFLFNRSTLAQLLINEPQEYTENIKLYTDRQTYFVKELVQFQANYIASDNMMDLKWSKVLYLELVSYDGTSFFQAKFPIKSNKIISNFILPTNIVTGNYYIKTYTKWMRNYPAENYCYVPIQIINPYSEQVLSKPSAHLSDFKIDTLSELPLEKLRINQKIINSDGKEKLFVEVLAIDSALNRVQFGNDFTCSIVDKSLINENIVINTTLMKEKKEFLLEYYPETRGISVSGKVIQSKTKVPLSFTVVNLTVTGENVFSYSVYSDSLGKFNFSLPDLYNEREIIISVDGDENDNSTILIDNDFCTRSIDLPFLPFNITKQEWEIWNLMSLKSQIFTEYASLNADEQTSYNHSMSLYSEPELTVSFDNYIEMPVLKDYFYEIISLAGIREDNGKHKIQVMGPYGELKVYKPLVLMDKVVVVDIDALLDVSPKLIDRVEVFNFPYKYGNITYGGIVNLYSKNGNLANMKLPESTKIFDYKTFSKKNEFVIEKGVNVPQLSNALFWSPSIEFKDGKCVFECEIGDNYGEYVLVIRGVDKEGNMYQKTQNIKIKSQS